MKEAVKIGTHKKKVNKSVRIEHVCNLTSYRHISAQYMYVSVSYLSNSYRREKVVVHIK